VRLEAWAITLSAGIVAGTVVPALAPMLVLASVIVSVGALLRRDLFAAEWRLMAILAPLFTAGGVGIAFVHAVGRSIPAQRHNTRAPTFNLP
jgi:hypothetical protein